MALTFISDTNTPNYLALSTDISGGKIAGASLVGTTVLLTDTGAWKIIDSDLNLQPYTSPVSGGGSPSQILAVSDPYGVYHRPVGSNVNDDEFSSDTLSDYTIVTPSGSVNWAISNNVLSCVFSGQAASDVCAVLKPMTLADGEWFETLLHIASPSAVNYTIAGLIITDGVLVTSKAQALFFYLDNSQDEYGFEMIKGTITSMATVTAAQNFHAFMAGNLRMQLIRTAANDFNWKVSTADGSQFSNFGNAGQDPAFTPTHAGLFVTTFGGVHTGITSFDFIRHMS